VHAQHEQQMDEMRRSSESMRQHIVSLAADCELRSMTQSLPRPIDEAEEEQKNLEEQLEFENECDDEIMHRHSEDEIREVPAPPSVRSIASAASALSTKPMTARESRTEHEEARSAQRREHEAVLQMMAHHRKEKLEAIRELATQMREMDEMAKERLKESERLRVNEMAMVNEKMTNSKSEEKEAEREEAKEAERERAWAQMVAVLRREMDEKYSEREEAIKRALAIELETLTAQRDVFQERYAATKRMLLFVAVFGGVVLLCLWRTQRRATKALQHQLRALAAK